MDPFGDGSGADADLSNFQAPTDAAAYNGDFYEVDSSETTATGATYDYGADDTFGDAPAPADETPAPMEEPSYAAPMESSSYEIPAAPMSYEAPAAASMPAPMAIEEDNELTKFMRKYEEEIAAKAAEQEKVAVESKDKAKTDMQKFVTERSRIKESKQQANRVQEQATLEKLAADLESENPWERVVTLVDMESNRKQRLAAALNKKDKGGKQEAEAPAKPAKKEEEEDVSRMRQLFVQLKAQPLEQTRVAAH